jgi:hypothetical protein
MPKVSTSAIESNSTPNWVVEFVMRATRPSRKSNNTAHPIDCAATSKWCDAEAMLWRLTSIVPRNDSVTA